MKQRPQQPPQQSAQNALQSLNDEIARVEQRSHQVLEQLALLSFRHTTGGNRRHGERRSSSERRSPDRCSEHPDCGGRRFRIPDRRVPLHERKRTLAAELDDLLVHSRLLSDQRRRLAGASH